MPEGGAGEAESGELFAMTHGAMMTGAGGVPTVNEPLALDKVQELGGDRDAVQALPLGSFISWNRLSQSRLDGRVF